MVLYSVLYGLIYLIPQEYFMKDHHVNEHIQQSIEMYHDDGNIPNDTIVPEVSDYNTDPGHIH